MHKHQNLEWRKVPLPELFILTTFSVLLWEFVYIRRVMPAVHRWAERQPFYENLMHRPGHMAVNGQDDITVLFVIAMHHLVAGSILLLGSFLGLPFLFEVGATLELGFEIADTAAMVRGAWPYVKGKSDVWMTLALFMHHVPGLLLIVPIFHTGLYADPYIRAVCAWLLFAGGVSSLAGSFIHTRDFEKPREMKQVALAHSFAGWVFMYARFVVFPMGIYHYAQDLDELGTLRVIPNAVRVLTIPMMIFNLIVLKLNVLKAFRYVGRAMGFSVNLYFRDHRHQQQSRESTSNDGNKAHNGDIDGNNHRTKHD